jgi:hypothetical protein
VNDWIERHPIHLSTDLGTETVLLNGETGVAVHLNRTARAVWLTLPAHRRTLVEQLCSDYSVSQAQAAFDVDQTIKSLLEHGLISVTDSPG